MAIQPPAKQKDPNKVRAGAAGGKAKATNRSLGGNGKDSDGRSSKAKLKNSEDPLAGSEDESGTPKSRHSGYSLHSTSQRIGTPE